MIMISSGAAQKVGRPPPPVPPRPSKTVVAEALAKSRQQHKATLAAAKTKSPARQAPPPPIPGQDIARSKSSYSVNVTTAPKKPVVFERSISEEVRNNSRTVVYQSSNVKCNNNGNGVVITRDDEGEVKIVNSNGGVFRNRDGVRVVGKVAGCDGEGAVQVFRKETVKRDKFCREKCVMSEGGKRTFGINCIIVRSSESD